MKYRIALTIALLSLTAGASATTLCQEKEQDIQREISYAEKHNNQNRINGLKKALSEVKAHCSDSKLRADHQEKIAEQKEEIAERQRDLQEAKQKGDADKISKRERKLAESQHELKELESRQY
ncbi:MULTISPECIES: DUF1090 domain-containing protein [Pseudocitrobacter]|uniref:DUF1090 domain-containing protein n=1 Tax=Pseudocitrobacter vendiensis TaxID=2488306 RepID=A0ABN8TCA7_9ENTR|nr:MULTISPECIES: DUF1090 domain-containing protein [Pseudocitrobacter]KAA1047947.1 DUF1090 domain-containing protein [Pseudocitrobacter sp. 73]CAH6660498.1 DUF1090 domain-containing protein [Pseudocitrobacter vendiensis]